MIRAGKTRNRVVTSNLAVATSGGLGGVSPARRPSPRGGGGRRDGGSCSRGPVWRTERGQKIRRGGSRPTREFASCVVLRHLLRTRAFLFLLPGPHPSLDASPAQIRNRPRLSLLPRRQIPRRLPPSHAASPPDNKFG
jgi:hypothetical protein